MLFTFQNQILDQLENINNTLRAFSLKLTGDDNDAEDLYQDTAFKIITNADKFRQDTNFKAWAITIMRNIFINNYRKKVRRNTIIDQTPNNFYLNSGTKVVTNDGESNIAMKELTGMVDKLPESFRTPFMMAYHGYKYDEIAEELEAPLGTVKSRIFFARKKLQQMYLTANKERA